MDSQSSFQKKTPSYPETRNFVALSNFYVIKKKYVSLPLRYLYALFQPELAAVMLISTVSLIFPLFFPFFLISVGGIFFSLTHFVSCRWPRLPSGSHCAIWVPGLSANERNDYQCHGSRPPTEESFASAFCFTNLLFIIYYSHQPVHTYVYMHTRNL